MRRTKQVLATEVKAGDKVWEQGFLFTITATWHGSDQVVLTGDCAEAPAGYSEGMRLGLRPNLYFTLEA